MTKEQITMLRSLIQQEIEAAGIDSFEHGAWGFAEKQLDKNWEEFGKSFEAPIEDESSSAVGVAVGQDLLDNDSSSAGEVVPWD